jgi:hypothetical protein
MGKSLVSKSGNDKVMTPIYLCQKIVNHFKPKGKILEPCCGSGNFLRVMPQADWCEIDKGKDFLQIESKYDWIITNPPYSKYREFLIKSMLIADNIVFLIPLVHIWTKARLRIMMENKFGIKEIYCVDTPKEFPQMGFQFGCVYYKKNYVSKTITQ